MNLETQKGASAIIFIILILLIGFAFLGYTYYSRNAEKQANEKSYNDLKSLKSKYDDKKLVAKQTPRIALASVLGDLNNFKSEVSKTQVSECMLPAKNDLAKHIEATNKAFTEFLGDKANEGDKDFENYVKQSVMAEKDFNNDIEKCKK